MRARVAGIGAGVVAVVGGGAAVLASAGGPAAPVAAVAETSAATSARPPITPGERGVAPSQRYLDVAAERAHAREHPMRPLRPVRAKKAPKKVDAAKAKKLAEELRLGAGTPKAHLVRAYRKAPSFAPAGCGIRPELLAAIGQVESGNIGGRSLTGHRVTPPVYGPPLTGGAFARISDSDGGRLDGSAAFDRAVGPMQFIPTTWAAWGTDADGDGRADPQNVYDAAASAARYLCAGGRNLSSSGSLRSAILSYNYSGEYVATVLSWQGFFERNGLEAIGDTSRFVPNGVVTSTTKSRDERADEPVVTPGPKDTVPASPATKPSSSSPTPTSTPSTTTPGTTSPSPSTPPSPGTTTPTVTETTEPTAEPTTPSPEPTPTEPDPASTTPPEPEPTETSAP